MIIHNKNNLIILLLAIVFGIIFGIMYQNLCEVHGPNANKVCKQIFRSKKFNKCIQFGVYAIDCPKKNSLFNIISWFSSKKN